MSATRSLFYFVSLPPSALSFLLCVLAIFLQSLVSFHLFMFFQLAFFAFVSPVFLSSSARFLLLLQIQLQILYESLSSLFEVIGGAPTLDIISR